jgi:hypothetical protein
MAGAGCHEPHNEDHASAQRATAFTPPLPCSTCCSSRPYPFAEQPGKMQPVTLSGRCHSYYLACTLQFALLCNTASGTPAHSIQSQLPHFGLQPRLNPSSALPFRGLCASGLLECINCQNRWVSTHFGVSPRPATNAAAAYGIPKMEEAKTFIATAAQFRGPGLFVLRRVLASWSE